MEDWYHGYNYSNYSTDHRFPVEAVAFAIWFVIGIVGTFVVPGSDKSLHRVFLWTTLACSYLFWLMVYMSQKFCILLPVDTRWQLASPEVIEFNAKRWNDW